MATSSRSMQGELSRRGFLKSTASVAGGLVIACYIPGCSKPEEAVKQLGPPKLVKANAFLHHMVRNITGSLLEVGMKKRPPEWIAQLLAARDRTKAAATAKAEGLYLVAVDYPAEFAIPQTSMGPLFLPDQLGA